MVGDSSVQRYLPLPLDRRNVYVTLVVTACRALFAARYVVTATLPGLLLLRLPDYRVLCLPTTPGYYFFYPVWT